MLNIEKVFVAHYSPLTERKNFLQNLLEKNNIIAEWIEEEPKDFVSFYYFSEELWNKKVKLFDYGSTISPRILKKSELSLAFKHIKIFENIANNNVKNALILEDDVLLINNFSNNFNYYLSQTPNDWDFIFIGNGCDLRVPIQNRIKHKIAYQKKHPAGKCTDSYIVNLNSVKKILNIIDKITLPMDFELNYLMWATNSKVYWWETPIVTQGSQCGLFQSQIQ